MPEMHLKQPGFTYSVCGLFTKSKERIQKFMETGNTISKNDLNKAYFQHDMAYGKHKDLTKITQSNKVLGNKAFKIANNPEYDGCQRRLASMVFKLFWKKSGNGIKSIPNQQQLKMNLINQLLENLKKEGFFLRLKTIFWASVYFGTISVDMSIFADMQLRSKYNKGIRYSLCVIDVFSKYAWVVPLSNKKRVTIVNAFQSILDSSKKQNKNKQTNLIWVDQGSEFYNSSFKNG